MHKQRGKVGGTKGYGGNVREGKWGRKEDKDRENKGNGGKGKKLTSSKKENLLPITSGRTC